MKLQDVRMVRTLAFVFIMCAVAFTPQVILGIRVAAGITVIAFGVITFARWIES